MDKTFLKYGSILLGLSIIFSGTAISAVPVTDDFSNITSYYEYQNKYQSAGHPNETVIVNGDNFIYTEDKNAKIDEIDGEKVLCTGNDGYVEASFNIPVEGMYNIELCYYPLEGKNNNIERILYINGKVPYDDLFSLSLPRIYTNEKGSKKYESDGNQMRTAQVEAPGFETLTLSGSNYNVNQPLSVYLPAGKNSIGIKAVKEPAAIKYIKFYQKKEELPYSEVSKKYPVSDHKEKTVHIEGEDAVYKSDKALYPVCDRTSPQNSPVAMGKTVMNMIGGQNWKSPLQYIEWNVNVETGGLYKIVIRGKQDYTAGQISTRKLTIDGSVPFYEAGNIEFPYAIGFQNYSLGNGKTTYQFYLTAGPHVLRLQNNVGDIGVLFEQLSQTVDELNSIYRQVFMITGAYPDADRDYNIEESLPNLPEEVKKVNSELNAVKSQYLSMTGNKGNGYATIEKLQVQLLSFIKDIESLPSRLDPFRINISNISAWLLAATEQPLLIDYIDIIPGTAEVKAAETGIPGRLWFRIQSFLTSFIVDYDAISQVHADQNKESVTVWLGTGRDQSQALKQVITSGFTPNYDIGVNIRLVDINVLLPAVAAGYGPDLAISLERSLPLNYAYRGAVQELSTFPDFNEVKSRFYSDELTEFNYRGKYYALPDKYTFYMMFYRKDILGKLGVSVPGTWDEVYTLLPKLQNQHMTIGLPNISDNVIDMFLTLLYQNNGSVYNTELTKSILDNEISIKAFKKFTDFYTKYSVYQKIDPLTYFRTGQTPLVIMPYTFYANLQAAAPEIKGQWGFTTIPGTKGTDGSINITSAGTSTGCCIFSNSRHKDAAWEFLKWWTGDEAQTEFGTEIENIQGTAGRYASANMKAVSMLPWSNSDLEVIMKQAGHTRALPEAPGGYMTSRYIVSSALMVINNGLIPRETIMDYNKMINDEVTSVSKKFGLS